MNDYLDYLAHHGIKGQKWGVRRYQNEDGTLTNKGKVRYDPKKHKKLNETEKKNLIEGKRKAIERRIASGDVSLKNGTHTTVSKKKKNVFEKIGDRREAKFNRWAKTHKLNKNYDVKVARSDSRRFGLHGVKSINRLMNKGKSHLWARNAVSIAQGYAMQTVTGYGLYNIKFKDD